MSLTKDEFSRYSRHLLLQGFGTNAQLKLKSARVLVIGAGGLGCPLLLYLAAAGIGTIGIIDYDRVDISNLQRQVLFKTADDHLFKAEAAAKNLRALNPLIDIIPIVDKLTSVNAMEIMQDYDVIADGSDNFPTRYLVNDASVLLGKPLVYGSVFRFEGQVSVFNYTDPSGITGPNYRDLFPVPPDPGSVPDCSEAGVLGVLPGIIGSLQALEVIKILTGIGEVLSGRIYHFDALFMQSQIFTIKRRSENPLNGADPSISHLIDYDDFCAGPYTGAASKDDLHGDNASSPIMEITPAEFEELKKTGEPYELIDVRSEAEYAIGNHGGTLVPLETVLDNAHRFRDNKKYIFHCMTGTRSAKAIKNLQDTYGLSNLYNIRF